MQTLKLFGDTKLYEDEKNIENDPDNLNQEYFKNKETGLETSQVQDKSVNGKPSSSKQGIPIPNNKKIPQEASSPNNNNSSFQANLNSNNIKPNFNYEKDDKTKKQINNINNQRKTWQSKNNMNTDNSEINNDEDINLSGLNYKNNYNTNIVTPQNNKKHQIKVVKNFNGNLDSNLNSNFNTNGNFKINKAVSNNNLNTSNLNLSSQTDVAIKTARNKSTRIGYGKDLNLNKSKDKSFQIDNEEEKIEKIKNLRHRFIIDLNIFSLHDFYFVNVLIRALCQIFKFYIFIFEDDLRNKYFLRIFPLIFKEIIFIKKM